MANWYVRSGAGGTASGADWTNAKLTLAAALTAGAAGDSFWVSEDHAETQATSMTLTSAGTISSPCFVYCVNHAGSVPPVSADLATTGTISTTVGSNLTVAGVAYYYGLTFNCGSGANSPNLFLSGAWLYLKNCALVVLATGVFSSINASSAAQIVTLDNTTVKFGNAGHQLTVNGQLYWKNTPTAIQGATLPTTLMAAASASVALVEGVDLSALGSGKTLVTALAQRAYLTFKDCKFGASVTVTGTPTVDHGGFVQVIRGDSSATNYRTERYRYHGTQTVETTIVRTGGATDGTTPLAWKLVTTANSKWVMPFEALPIAIWGDTTASTTLTVYGVWGGGAVPLNDEIWIEVEYLGASGNPQGSFATSTKADTLATGSNTTSDASTWGGSTTAFKMAVTFTPAQKGAIYVYVKAAKASSTFYIDPKPVLT